LELSKIWLGVVILPIILINFISSYFELFGALVCMLSIFRMPIRYYLHKIAIITFLITVISLYTFAYFPDFAFFINFSCMVVIVSIIYRIAFFYSLLMVAIYYLLGIILEYSLTIISTKLLKIPDQYFALNTLGLNGIFVTAGILLLVIAWLIQRKKIGFMFIERYFTMRQSVKGYNFALSAILVISIVTLQLISTSYVEQSFHIFLLVGITILFLAGINVAYRQNKKQLDEKHKRLSKR
jgi:hypothetical protein